ncbi:response regulator [Paenibacillus oryzisoli]|uniref:DNA-binding response regulator n=1 Tax=Paenibacillus oryzisoli TaxID=1850517 RepID=A0A198A8P9_9BACL|nr:response regulator [Paenibacillus oryzisoli]OAS17844.1 DNA-binding response regulator [Paenibacillus oryzisoli]
MKLIVVDDEKGIVDGLRRMINRYIPECEVIGTAHNGLEGFELIQTLQPDLVITDIRMPKADGLDMIKMLNDVGSQAKFILLSGYTDFEYARRGMQLGVHYYINKPVEVEQLRECVGQVMEKIRLERTKMQEMNELKQEVLTRKQEKAWRDVLDLGSDNSDFLEELLQMAQIPMENASFLCAILELDGSAAAMKELSLHAVFEHIDRIFKQYQGVFRFRYAGSQVAIVIAHGESIKYEDLVRASALLKEEVQLELNLSATVGIGTIQKSAAGVSQSFEEASYALSYKFIKGSDEVIPFPEINNLTGPSHAVPEELIAKLEAGLDNMDESGCVETIREIFRGMEAEKNMRAADHQSQCLNILLSCVRNMPFQQLQQNDFLGRHILSLESISRSRTLEHLEEWTLKVIRRIISFKLEHNIPKKKDIITEIKDYLVKNYKEPIRIADLASRFFISPLYLSQFFKQKTGETYVNFLTQIRINKAKELLQSTDLKVYEICEMVGYSDTQHFARLFEKLTGCKPREYRKNIPNA